MPVRIYSAIHNSSPGLEWDVYRAALELRQLASRYPPSSGSIGLWYANNTGSLLNSVQSGYLWGFSKVASPNDPKAGMPDLTEADMARILQFQGTAEAQTAGSW